MFLKITITIVILICILVVWINHKPISYIADLPQTEMRTEYVPQHKLHIVGNGHFGTPPEEILSVTQSHNITIGATGCNIEGDYQFVIFADKTYKTTMTPEEYETINAVIERAASK